MNYVIETSTPSWATEMKQLLLDIKGAVSVAREAGKTRLALRQEKDFLGQYEKDSHGSRKALRAIAEEEREAQHSAEKGVANQSRSQEIG